jgi:phosphoribosylglycinamide formyltransferase 1
MHKLAVMISGRGSNLGALIEAQAKMQARVAVVISDNPDAKGLDFARAHTIPYHVMERKDFDTRQAFDQALATKIDDYQPDLVVLAGFMRVLGADFVNHYAGKIVNIHPSLLPKYKGLDTHQRVLDAGDREHGATVHFVTPELDSGAIIRQVRVPVLADDTADSLATRVLAEEHRLYPLAIQDVLAGQ